MTAITEIKPGCSTDVICPLMSGQLIPAPVGNGNLMTPGQTLLAPVQVTCALERCAWYHEEHSCCLLVTLGNSAAYLSANVLSLRHALEPASKSPLGGVADALNEIVRLLKTKKG